MEKWQYCDYEMPIYLYSDLGDVVFNAIGDATKRNSRFDGLSVSSNEIIASVMLRFSGGFALIIFLLKTLVCSAWKNNVVHANVNYILRNQSISAENTS